MSHFTVLVVGSDPEKQLAPYHEFECTGRDDEFVQDVDQTEEVQMQIDRDGFEEGLAYFGLEDRVVTSEGEICKSDKHKYGYAVVKDGKLIKAVNRTNPNRKWDWYVLGGRWSGFFKLKPGAAGDVGKPGVFGNVPRPRHADSAQIKDIDFKGMMDDDGNEARSRYEMFERMCGGSIPKLEYTWRQLLDDPKYSSMSIEDKRTLYGNQEAIKFKNELRVKYWESKNEEERNLAIWSEMEDFQCTKDEYEQRARNRAIATFALVKDGKWYEKGEMGWFGMAHNEKDQDRWNEEFISLINNLPEDTVISVYDCHI